MNRTDHLRKASHSDWNPDDGGMQRRNLAASGRDYMITGQISRLRCALLEMTSVSKLAAWIR